MVTRDRLGEFQLLVTQPAILHYKHTEKSKFGKYFTKTILLPDVHFECYTIVQIYDL